MKDNNTSNDNVLKISALQSDGRRLTSQRALLLNIISNSDDHLDAEALYRLAKEKDSRISLSTVYRTLSLLKQLHMVEELHLAEEHHHYEARSKKEHYHLVCTRCGRVIEFYSPLIEQLGENLSKAYGFSVVETRTDVSGICGDCKEAFNL